MAVFLFGVFGVITPAVITFYQCVMMVLFFPLWAGLVPINGPLTFGGLAYFGVLIWQIIVAMTTAPAVPAEAEAEAES